MTVKWRLFIRRFIRKITLLRIRAAIGQAVRDHRRKKMALFISSAEELSYTLKHSQVLSSCPIWNPNNDNFQFLIPAKDSHINFLNKNLENIAEKYGNHIIVNILVSERVKNLVQVPDLLQGRVKIISESTYENELGQLQPFIAKYNEIRWSWFKQQCLKTLFVDGASTPVVILDADTLLVKPINFQPNGKNLLLMGSDTHSHFHAPYSIHIQRYLGINPLPINFTQHCQLQIPKIVNEIYTENVVKGLSEWLNKGRSPFEFSPVCEYQTYAEYARKTYPSKTTLFSHTHHLSYLPNPDMELAGSNVLDVNDHLLGNCQDNCDLVTMLN